MKRRHENDQRRTPVNRRGEAGMGYPAAYAQVPESDRFVHNGPNEHSQGQLKKEYGRCRGES